MFTVSVDFVVDSDDAEREVREWGEANVEGGSAMIVDPHGPGGGHPVVVVVAPTREAIVEAMRAFHGEDERATEDDLIEGNGLVITES